MSKQELTIDDYLAQGHSRIKAIKLFYESSLKNNSTNIEKTYQGPDFENGIVRNQVDKLNELARPKVIEVQREGRMWRVPLGSNIDDFERLKEEGLVSLAPTEEEELAEQQRALSEGRVWVAPIVLHEADDGSLVEDEKSESVFSALQNKSISSYDRLRQSLNLGDRNSLTDKDKDAPPTSLQSQTEHTQRRSLNLAPMSKVHSSMFQHTNAPHNDDEDDEDDDDLVDESEDDLSLGGNESTEDNMNRFLSLARYSADELREFYFCVESGLDIDEASDMVLQRRINLMAQQGIDFVKEVRKGRLPLRYSPFTGQRSDDLEMLLVRKYPLSIANHVLDLVYARKFRIPFGHNHIVPKQNTVISSQRLSFGGVPSLNESSNKQQKQRRSFTGHDDDELLATLSVCEPSPSQTMLNIPPPIAIPPATMMAAPSQSISQHSTPSFATNQLNAPSHEAVTVPEWHRGFNFDAKRGMLRATLNMSSAYDDSEHELLRISLLISQQEAQFGVNMYDALLPTDEATIAALVKRGHTLDEAVLAIFETRFGKTRPVSPNTADMLAKMERAEQRPRADSNALSTASTVAEKPISYAGVDSLEAEIALLKTMGYTREDAVQILLERKRQESTTPTEGIPHAPSQDTHTHTQRHAVSPAPAQHNAHSTPRTLPLSQQAMLRSASQKMPQQMLSPPQPPQQQGLHRAPSQQRMAVQQSPLYGTPQHMQHFSPQRQQSSHTISRAFSDDDDDMSHITDPTMLVPPGHLLNAQGLPVHPRSPLLHYAPQMHSPAPHSPLLTTPGARGPQRVYTPPHTQVNAPLPTHAHAHGPQIYNRQEERTLHGLTADERALRIGLLVSQQDAAHGCNMYDSFHAARDEADAQALRGAGFSDDEAALIIFERKFGPTGCSERSERRTAQPNRSPLAPPAGVSIPQGMSPQFAPHSALRPKAFTPRNGSPYTHNGAAASPLARQASLHSQHNAPAPAPAPAPQRSQQQLLEERENLELAQALALSQKESNFRPGAVRMAGVGQSSPSPAPAAGHGGSDSGSGGAAVSAEVAMLTSMGFSRDQAVAALRNCGNNVEAAADMLLSGM